MVEEMRRYAIRFLSRQSKNFSLKKWRQINNSNYTKLLTLPKTATDAEIAALLDNIFGNSGGSESSTTPQSGTRIAYLPFTEDLTDAGGNEWTTYGNPQIQDGKLYLNGSSYLQNDSISDKIGSDIWTIHYYAALTGSGNRYSFGTFNANYGTSGMVKNSWIAMNHHSNKPAFVFFQNDTSINLTLVNGEEHHFAVSYDGTLVRVFIDGVLQASKEQNVKLGGAFRIGCAAGRNDYGDCYVGTIRNFTVLKGVAYTENFTPPE